MLVSDVLHHGTDDLPGLVVRGVSVPVRVHALQEACQSVVLPEPQGVH